MKFPSCCKTILLTIFGFIIGLCSYAQKTEIKLNAYSGLFFYRGNGSSSATTIYGNANFAYLDFTPFGRKSTFPYAFEIQIQKVTRKRRLYGLGIGWEELKSLTRIDSIAVGDLVIPTAVPIKGKINIASAFLTFNPYIGQRFVTGKWAVDLLAGIDLSVCTRLQETAYLSSAGSKYYRYYQGYRNKYFGDLRPRIEINSVYRQFGITVGYSLGLLNLYRMDGYYYQPTNFKAYSNFLRLGISYKLK